MLNQKTREILLMTATLQPGMTPYVGLQDSNERLAQYLCSLISWITLTDIQHIIFCENSGTTYDFSRIQQFAKDYHKNLDILIFQGNEQSAKYGKGWGEGKIIEYALQNSQALDLQTCFYKVTGRYFVKNFTEIQEKHIDIPNVFTQSKILPKYSDRLFNYSNQSNFLQTTIQSFKQYLFYLKMGYLYGRPCPDFRTNTIFFKSQVDFFKKHLLKSYRKVNDRRSYVLEKVYTDALKGQDFSPFLTYFELVGMSGTKPKSVPKIYYSESIQKMARDFM